MEKTMPGCNSGDNLIVVSGNSRSQSLQYRAPYSPGDVTRDYVWVVYYAKWAERAPKCIIDFRKTRLDAYHVRLPFVFRYPKTGSLSSVIQDRQLAAVGKCISKRDFGFVIV